MLEREHSHIRRGFGNDWYHHGRWGKFDLLFQYIKEYLHIHLFHSQINQSIYILELVHLAQ